MDRSKIEWLDGGATWNPVMGCTPVSEACTRCYARAMMRRYAGRKGWPASPDSVTLFPERLDIPLKWKKPRRIFTVSMGDLFHEDVPDEFIFQVYRVMQQCPQHTFILLTKRPDRMLQIERVLADAVSVAAKKRSMNPCFVDELIGAGIHLPHVWRGVTAENQQRADERIPILLQIPAAVHLVSVEPMLSAVDLDRASALHVGEPGSATTWRRLDWVVCGGETGPGARPIHPDWVRALRDQCKAAGVPFYFKSWGDWLPNAREYGCAPAGASYNHTHVFLGDVAMCRMGKRAAGHLLDGAEHREYPR